MPSMMGVDEDRGHVFFRANGREEGEDPYYQHLYRVNLNGTGLTLLTPGDFDHRAVMDESSRYFVDNYSKVNTAPASAKISLLGSVYRALSSVGRAPARHAGGHWFEPSSAHLPVPVVRLAGSDFHLELSA